MMGKLIRNGKAPIQAGALGEWTKARDLPTPTSHHKFPYPTHSPNKRFYPHTFLLH